MNSRASSRKSPVPDLDLKRGSHNWDIEPFIDQTEDDEEDPALANLKKF